MEFEEEDEGSRVQRHVTWSMRTYRNGLFLYPASLHESSRLERRNEHRNQLLKLCGSSVRALSVSRGAIRLRNPEMIESVADVLDGVLYQALR